jgi:hypothetical protein
VNPEAFKVIDGKLYLNWSESSADEFETDAENNIKTADENWDEIIQKN